MSFSVLGDLNWFAVIVATIVYFGLGGLWYAEFLFGKAWQRAMGWDGNAPEGAGAGIYVVPLATCFVATLATAMIAAATGTDTVGEGIVLAIVVGIGLSAAVLAVTGMFDSTKPAAMTTVAISAGYHFTGLLLASVILALWQ
ncbi:uncharacterized protein DUF1761 [Lentzea atacamensis]|uniref:Uncharacterized protein DUF1761 n=2 Tax=Lentzea TaxID=165301 RepID=A0A316HQW4_9PSEU|nr:DUF1761 domain-containing protein [Lentzea atacamensis]PWK83005.1 uncharacterized protein DUF1761 [Lentzea atacamensis]RAS62357.1 uncharacterized protein DUF1761 [Lentzea atacamensis]